jgi:hypothetical protein
MNFESTSIFSTFSCKSHGQQQHSLILAFKKPLKVLVRPFADGNGLFLADYFLPNSEDKSIDFFIF